jgi:hypothetical protein
MMYLARLGVANFVAQEFVLIGRKIVNVGGDRSLPANASRIE